MRSRFPQISEFALETGGLEVSYANLMIENCIGKMSLPLGLGLNFKINRKEYAVPMSIEEPSVIAAASGAAKLIKDLGDGFNAWSTDPIMTGQIQVLDIDPIQAQQLIEANKKAIVSRQVAD